MQAQEKLPARIQQALDEGLLARIPLTFLPYVNQQLSQWDVLFPRERQSVERLLLYVASLTPEQSGALFRPVVELENKMGVRNWQFSIAEQTIQNSSQLASSPYFQEWRRAVQTVFDASDDHALKTDPPAVKARNRLVLLGIPRARPLDEAGVWRRWQGTGRPVKLDLAAAGRQSALEFLVAGAPAAQGVRPPALLDAMRKGPEDSAADVWVVDAGKSLVESVLTRDAAPSERGAVLLSYARLDRYRESFSREMNTMRKDLADADAVFDRLRKVDVTPWCPPEVAADAALREYLRSLYLTGNGAVIFGNSFVQWGASEAIRRARPAFVAAQFGMRSKPKPFTGVAVFDNPDQINPLPAVDDVPGSALDAQMLALYVWLSAIRYQDYQSDTVCVCVAESISQAYLVAPPEFSMAEEKAPLTLDRLGQALRAWIA